MCNCHNDHTTLECPRYLKVNRPRWQTVDGPVEFLDEIKAAKLSIDTIETAKRLTLKDYKTQGEPKENEYVTMYDVSRELPYIPNHLEKDYEVTGTGKLVFNTRPTLKTRYNPNYKQELVCFDDFSDKQLKVKVKSLDTAEFNLGGQENPANATIGSVYGDFAVHGRLIGTDEISGNRLTISDRVDLGSAQSTDDNIFSDYLLTYFAKYPLYGGNVEPSLPNQFVTKKYVDEHGGGGGGTDPNAVHKTGHETIDGIKTFVTLPHSSLMPSLDTEFAIKKYVDEHTGRDPDAVHKSCDEIISGIKTFTTLPQSEITPTDPKEFITLKYFKDNSIDFRGINVFDGGSLVFQDHDTGGFTDLSSTAFNIHTPVTSNGQIFTLTLQRDSQHGVFDLSIANNLMENSGIRFIGISSIEMTHAPFILNHSYTPGLNQLVTKKYVDEHSSGGEGVVHTTGNETIDGLKTFLTLPQSQLTPTLDGEFITLKYFKDHGGSGTDPNAVHKTGDESIDGIKTFVTLPRSTVTPTDPTHFATKRYVDEHSSGGEGVVHTTGNETIDGLKTFLTLPQSSATPSEDEDLITLEYYNNNTPQKKSSGSTIIDMIGKGLGWVFDQIPTWFVGSLHGLAMYDLLTTLGRAPDIGGAVGNGIEFLGGQLLRPAQGEPEINVNRTIGAIGAIQEMAGLDPDLRVAGPRRNSAPNLYGPVIDLVNRGDIQRIRHNLPSEDSNDEISFDIERDIRDEGRNRTAFKNKRASPDGDISNASFDLDAGGDGANGLLESFWDSNDEDDRQLVARLKGAANENGGLIDINTNTIQREGHHTGISRISADVADNLNRTILSTEIKDISKDLDLLGRLNNIVDSEDNSGQIDIGNELKFNSPEFERPLVSSNQIISDVDKYKSTNKIRSYLDKGGKIYESEISTSTLPVNHEIKLDVTESDISGVKNSSLSIGADNLSMVVHNESDINVSLALQEQIDAVIQDAAKQMEAALKMTADMYQYVVKGTDTFESIQRIQDMKIEMINTNKQKMIDHILSLNENAVSLRSHNNNINALHDTYINVEQNAIRHVLHEGAEEEEAHIVLDTIITEKGNFSQCHIKADDLSILGGMIRMVRTTAAPHVEVQLDQQAIVLTAPDIFLDGEVHNSNLAVKSDLDNYINTEFDNTITTGNRLKLNPATVTFYSPGKLEFRNGTTDNYTRIEADSEDRLYFGCTKNLHFNVAGSLTSNRPWNVVDSNGNVSQMVTHTMTSGNDGYEYEQAEISFNLFNTGKPFSFIMRRYKNGNQYKDCILTKESNGQESFIASGNWL